jgi:hypothetical protein
VSKISISAEASIFFTKHGWVELELDRDDLDELIEKNALLKRDLWRSIPQLQKFLTRKLAPLALALSGKKQLLLGFDQVFSEKEMPRNSCPLKEIISVQGLALGIVFSKDPKQALRKTELGIVPMPSSEKRILFFRPDIILDFPHAKSDIYMALYVLPSAVYVQNGKDPDTNFLRKLGYNFGDVLKPSLNPMVM